MRAFAGLILEIISLYEYVVIAYIVVSWLISFGVINTYNRFVAQANDVLYRLTEPVLQPIRNLLPNLGGLDISPIILFVLLRFLQNLIVEYTF